MQTVSTTWDTLWSGNHRAVVKAVINDNLEFDESSLVSVAIKGALYGAEDLSFGGCISRQLDLSFYPGNVNIPRMAKIQLFLKLQSGNTSSEWLSKGIFYIDTREKEASGLMKITAYDAMLKAEQEFTFGSTALTCSQIINTVSTAIGVTYDATGTSLTEYSFGIATGYSMREMLGFVAVSNGGNFVITEQGKLRLIKSNRSRSTYIASNSDILAFESSDTYSAISKVILKVTDEQAIIVGTDTGRTIEMDMPWGTTAMANALLSQLSAFSYTPHTTTILLNPKYEIGDCISYNGVSYEVATHEYDLNSILLSDIEAPGENAIDHEYPYESASKRADERTIAEIKEETAELRVTTAGLSTRVTDAESNITTLQQTVAGFTITATNGTETSVLKLMSGSTELSSATIRITGMVKFTDLSGSGSSTINGDNITTGTISAITMQACTFNTLLSSTGTVNGMFNCYYRNYNTLAGGIKLDDAGDGSSSDAKYRMFLFTNYVGDNIAFALKLQSAAGISIAARYNLYLKAQNDIDIVSTLGDVRLTASGGNMTIQAPTAYGLSTYLKIVAPRLYPTSTHTNYWEFKADGIYYGGVKKL